MAGINWGQALVGVLIGSFATLVVLDPVKHARDRAYRRIRRWFRRLRRRRLEAVGLLHFGKVPTTWRVLDGDGGQRYVQVMGAPLQPPLELPDDLRALKHEIEEEQQARHAQGLQYFWNGRWWALDSYVLARVGPDEDPTLELLFRECDYYSFLATSLSLDRTLPDGLTVREKYLNKPDWAKPATALSTSFGINIALVTSDDYMVVVRRGERVGSLPGAYSTSINEALNVADSRASGPDVRSCAVRGGREELGLDIATYDVDFLSLGVDTALAQWGLLGMVKTKMTYDEVVKARSGGAKDMFEADEIFAVEFTPEAVAEFVRQQPLWAPGGLACIYHALINTYSRRRVDRALSRFT